MSRLLNEADEAKYRRKCHELKRRIDEVETNNESLELKLVRTKRYIRRLRLERAMLLDKFELAVRSIGSGELGPDRLSPTPPKSPPLEVTFFDAPPEPRPFSPPHQEPRSGRHYYEELGPDGSVLAASTGTPGPGGAGSTAGDETPAKAPSTKKKRDPLEPKRPKNAFLRFCETERESVKVALEAQAIDGEQIDLAKEMGRVWSGMDEHARKPYYDAYEEDKKRYEREYADYTGKKLPNRRSRAHRPGGSNNNKPATPSNAAAASAAGAADTSSIGTPLIEAATAASTPRPVDDLASETTEQQHTKREDEDDEMADVTTAVEDSQKEESADASNMNGVASSSGGFTPANGSRS
ncbi:non-histone protein [Savitreella phatthalungensis]